MIDTHAHLSDERFGGGEEAYRRAKEAGVGNIIAVGFNEESSLKEKAFAKSKEDVFFAAGVHPSDCAYYDGDLESRLINILDDEKAVAVGEIGLDYYYGKDDREIQKSVFERQVILAKKLNLPYIVHSRDAAKDTMDIIERHSEKGDRGFLLHCYSGSLESALKYITLGGYFAFGGAITFKNAKKEEIIRGIPLDRIFCETDCPYMAPVPLRGTLNEPGNVRFVYNKMAEIYGISLEKLIAAVRENAVRFFGRKEFGKRNG